MTEDALQPVGPGPAEAAGAPASASDTGDRSLLALIDRLAGLLDRSDLTELEVESGGTAVTLRKPSAVAPAVLVGAAPAPGAPTTAGPVEGIQ